MKINIFNEQQVALEQEQEITLKLIKRTSGNVTLQAVDKDGEVFFCGNILNINTSGKLLLHSGVSQVLGLSLDDEGCIEIENI